VKNCLVLEYIRFVSLTRVGGSCIYLNLPRLFSIGSATIGEFGGFGFISFGGGVRYENLPELVWITGFAGLSEIRGDLYFINVPKLESLEAYQSIIHLFGCLHLIQTTQIVDFSGLDSLELIGEDIRIIDNDQIMDVSQLGNLITLNGSLIIRDNDNLMDLEGLRNLLSVADSLVIMDNINLHDCCVINALLQSDRISGPVIISENLEGCLSPENINTTCTMDCPELGLDIGNSCMLNGDIGMVSENCICLVPTDTIPVDTIPSDPITIPVDASDTPLLCDVLISSDNNSITISNLNDGRNSFTIFTHPDFELVDDSCQFEDACPESVTISDLPPGNYAIVLHSLTSVGDTVICNTWEYVTISEPTIETECDRITLEKVGEDLVINSPETHLMIVDIFDMNHQLVFHCNMDCNVIENIEGLAAGNYIVKIKVYDENCKLLCFDRQTISFGGNGLQVGRSRAQNSFVLTGFLNQAAVNLQWVHVKQQTDRQFTIERSEDGILFEQISTEGGEAEKYAYTTIDPNPVIGVNFYRIRATYPNGDYKQSETVAVPWIPSSALQLFPNPTIDQVMIYTEPFLDKSIDLKIYNLFGQAVYEQYIEKVSTNRFQVNTAHLDGGTYFVSIIHRGRAFSAKLIVMRY